MKSYTLVQKVRDDSQPFGVDYIPIHTLRRVQDMRLWVRETMPGGEWVDDARKRYLTEDREYIIAGNP